MAEQRFSFSIFIVLSMLCCGQIIADEQSTKLAGAINDFSIRSYKELSKTNDNLIYSGFSVATVLNMLLTGTRTTTEQEMRDTLGYNQLSLTNKQSQDSYHQLLTKQRSANGYDLNVANSMWIQSGFNILPEFTSIIKNVFYSVVEEVDFRTQPTAAEVKINKWVSKETKGKIPELFKNSLDSSTKIALVNAIYFKGKWVTQFKKNATKDYPFKMNGNNSKKNISMMNVISRFRYSDNTDLSSQILELPYNGNDISMIIVLPKAVDGLSSLEKQMTVEKLKSAIDRIYTTKVVVKIPKFESTSTLPLNQVLQNLGIKKAFTEAADLSGIDGQRDLYVSQAIQKALIEVNEEGTVAAAATGIVCGRAAAACASVSEEVYFIADHPFLYFIYQKTTDVVLFMGKYNKP